MRTAHLVVGVTLLALGCGGSEGTSPGPAVAASVTLAPATLDTLFSFGETAQLTATVKDASGAPLQGAAVTFQSSAVGIAGVSGSGGVTAIGNGAAIITATSGSAAATVPVRVRQKLSRVVASPPSGGVAIGRTLTISTTPQDARGNAIAGLPAASYSSDNAGTARVDGAGVVTGVALGTANITASVTSTADGTKSAVVPVTVSTAPPAAATVTMPSGSNTFAPNSTEISLGGTVTWTNNSGIPHDVDFGTPSMHIAVFDSGQRSLTFPTAGTFNYFCNLHAGMTGTIVVR